MLSAQEKVRVLCCYEARKEPGNRQVIGCCGSPKSEARLKSSDFAMKSLQEMQRCTVEIMNKIAEYTNGQWRISQLTA